MKQIHYESGLTTDDHEPLCLYENGGLHPVSLGSWLPFPFHKQKELRIIHKLGHSNTSTLWLARDKIAKRYVSVEIMTATLDTEAFQNMQAIHKLAASKNSHPGEGFATVIENASFKGPSGVHNCFIYHPPLGPDFAAPFWCWELPHTKPENVELHGYLLAETRRRFARKAAEELAWLHENGIGHGDFRPMNVLNPLINLDDKTEAQVLELIGDPIEGRFHVWGKPNGPSHPETIVRRAIAGLFPQPYLMDKVQLVGFQWSFDINNPSKKAPADEYAQITGYWAPEVIFENQIGAPAEVWALACTLYEIRMDHRLFYEDFRENTAYVIWRWCSILGYIPEKWWAQYHEMKYAGGSYDEYTMQDILRGARNDGKSDLSEEEVEVFSDLLLKMLCYEKEDRITIDEVLKHPWMTRSFT